MYQNFPLQVFQTMCLKDLTSKAEEENLVVLYKCYLYVCMKILLWSGLRER
jgi:hypothetical protein